MGCGSAKPEVAPQQNVAEPEDRNGVAKNELPPQRQTEQCIQPQIKEIKQDRPKEKRKDSAKSKSSSGSSSRSSSAKSQKSRPETSPGGNDVSPTTNEQVIAKEATEQQHEMQQQTVESVESNNNAEKPVEEATNPEEPAKVEAEETVDETTTQGAATEETSNDQGHEKPNFSEDALKEFVDLQNQLKSLEEKSAGNNYGMKHTRLVELHKNLNASHEILEKLKAQTAKEYQDVVDFNAAFNMRSMFINQAQMNADYQKEQNEYLDAVNKQEIAQQEFENLKSQYKKLYNEVTAAKDDQEELNKLRSKEEELLGRIFNDSYGSDKEWKLEMELDLLGQRKDRINAAYVRWRAAHVYLDTATKQLSWSTRRWAQIATHKVTILVVKYQMVAETRNHLIAAAQNITSAHGNLKPVNIPYFTDVDLQQLQQITRTIFNDVNIPNNYQNSYYTFASLFSKCSHLLQWVNQVLQDTISKDLAGVKKEFQEKYYELKEERMSLIKAKVKEKLGVELEVEVTKDELSSDESSSLEGADIAEPGEVAKEEGDEEAPAPDENEGVPDKAPPPEEGEVPPDGGEAGPAETEAATKRVPLSELAPAPTAEDLFGNIDQLKKQHEDELAEFEKAQEINKARVQQGLQEKLRARRSRRRKIQGQEAETNQLTQGGGSSSEPPPPSEMGL